MSRPSSAQLDYYTMQGMHAESQLDYYTMQGMHAESQHQTLSSASIFQGM